MFALVFDKSFKSVKINDYSLIIHENDSISDFVMPSFDEQNKNQINKVKENKTKFHSLVIGNSGHRCPLNFSGLYSCFLHKNIKEAGRTYYQRIFWVVFGISCD